MEFEIKYIGKKVEIWIKDGEYEKITTLDELIENYVELEKMCLKEVM